MKTCRPDSLRPAKPLMAGARRVGAVMVVAAALGLSACGGGDDDESGTPLVPVTPSAASSAEAASASSASHAQR